MNCPYCKAPMDEELLDYTVTRNGVELSLEEVPTWVCPQCDATVVEDEVLATVEDMLAELETFAVLGEEE